MRMARSNCSESRSTRRGEKVDFEPHFRVIGTELQEEGAEDQFVGKSRWHTDAQAAAWRDLSMLCKGESGLGFFLQTPRVLEDALAEFRQRELARAAR